jgi:phenylacetate-CoA ligase
MRISPVEFWIRSKLNGTQSLSVSRLREYQLGKLRETLEYVLSHSRFYRERLKGLDPSSIQSKEDLARLPLTQPEELAGGPNDFLCVSPREISRIITLPTSGTTGQPKRIAFTPEDQEQIIDFFHYGITTLVDGSDRVIIFLPGKTEGSVGDLLKKALSRFGCEGIIFGPIENCDDAIKALLETKPTSAVGIPSQFLALSRHAESRSLSRRIQFNSVLLSTDNVPRSIVDSLRQKWGCQVFNHYGMTEMGLGGGVDCAAHDGYHTRDADLLFEIIDPITEEPLADGEYGEVVFSTLTRLGMPLIRYRTGDISRFLAQPCSCGSVLKRMECISGRAKEPVQLANGLRLSITQLDEILFRNPGVYSYTAEMCLKSGSDCLVLTIQSVQESFDPDRMVNELCRQLSIENLVAQERLSLDIRKGEAGHFTTGTAKRSIVDRRSPTVVP